MLSLYALESSHLGPLGLNQAKECETRGVDIEALPFSQALEGALLDELQALSSGDRDAQVRHRYSRDMDVHKAHREFITLFHAEVSLIVGCMGTYCEALPFCLSLEGALLDEFEGGASLALHPPETSVANIRVIEAAHLHIVHDTMISRHLQDRL